MVECMRNHIILALRAVAISRLQVAESEEDFVDGFFENVLHGGPASEPGMGRAHGKDALIGKR
jgi:hypothetical protein